MPIDISIDNKRNSGLSLDLGNIRITNNYRRVLANRLFRYTSGIYWQLCSDWKWNVELIIIASQFEVAV